MQYNRKFIKTKDFLLSVIRDAPNGIIAFDLEGNITIVNNRAITLLNLENMARTLLEMKIFELLSELDEVKARIQKNLTQEKKNFNIEEVYHYNRYLSFKGRKISGGMVISIVDNTSIKESKYIALNSLMEGQELERKRLAREIHDGIGPILSTVKMNLANIEGDVDNINPELKEKFQKSYEMIDDAAGDLRSISHNLMPKVLSDFGLNEALETLCEKIDATRSVDVDFINSGLFYRLNEVTELGLYRISQELLNNTLKYAKAKKVILQLIKRDETIRLMYEDDGIGFFPEKVNRGIGLMNIENRATALAGQAIIDSMPGKGMTATIEIPLNLK